MTRLLSPDGRHLDCRCYLRSPGSAPSAKPPARPSNLRGATSASRSLPWRCECTAILPLLRGSTIAAKSGPYGRSGCPSQINRSTGNPWPAIALGYRGSSGSHGMPRERHFLTRGGSGQLYAFPAAGRFCHFGRHSRLHRLPRPMVVQLPGIQRRLGTFCF